MTRAHLAIAASAIASTLVAPRASAQDREKCIAAFDEGQSHRLRGALRAARASFLTCAADACPVPLRKDCVQALSALDAELPTIVLGARDAAGNDVIPSAVFVDDQRVTTLDGRALAEDPGPHVIRFEHPPSEPVVEHVVLRTGERNRTILATFPSASPPPAPPPVRTAPAAPADAPRPMGWIYATGALGVVGLAAFGIFGVAGFVEKQHLMDRCAPACADSDVAKVRFDYVTGDVSLGVGVVSLGVAAYLFLSSSPPQRAPAVSLAPTRDGAVVGWRGSF
jgi:hypothetical protein